MLAKNPKNYRPIARENNMLKIYTALIAYFLDEDCRVNDIIALNQAGGRKGSWDHIDQLLKFGTINLMFDSLLSYKCLVWVTVSKC